MFKNALHYHVLKISVTLSVTTLGVSAMQCLVGLKGIKRVTARFSDLCISCIICIIYINKHAVVIIQIGCSGQCA